MAGIRAANNVLEGTRLAGQRQVIEGIIHANPFAYWWRGPPPVC